MAGSYRVHFLPELHPIWCERITHTVRWFAKNTLCAPTPDTEYTLFEWLGQSIDKVGSSQPAAQPRLEWSPQITCITQVTLIRYRTCRRRRLRRRPVPGARSASRWRGLGIAGRF